MRTSDIKVQLTQQPFVPFRLCMSDGQSLDVRHPEMLLVTRTMLAVALHRNRGGELEGLVLCDPVHFIRIEPLTNGRPKARRSRKN